MYVIIAGCGAVGSQLANTLAKAMHNIVVIDEDNKSFEQLEPGFNGRTVHGNTIDVDVQKKAAMAKADVFIAVTQNDNANLMAAQIAKKIFSVELVIARASGEHAQLISARHDIEIIFPVTLQIQKIMEVIA